MIKMIEYNDHDCWHVWCKEKAGGGSSWLIGNLAEVWHRKRQRARAEWLPTYTEKSLASAIIMF